MTNAATRQKLSAENALREVRHPSTGNQKPRRMNEHFALRDQNPVSGLAVRNADNAVSDMFRDWRIYVVNRQAGHFDKRWHSHFLFSPAPHAREQHNANVQNRTLNLKLHQIIRHCAASCPVSKQELRA